jgi:hypothetical protein
LARVFSKSPRSLPLVVPDKIAPLDFPKKWHNIPHEDGLKLARLNQMKHQATSEVDAWPQPPLTKRTLWHFSAANNE